MAIRFNIPEGQGVALTEKCRNREEFGRSARTKDPSALARHMAECPACRKVALDAVKALASSGDPFRPPAPIKELARRLSGKKSDDKIKNIISVSVKNNKVTNLSGIVAMEENGSSFEEEKKIEGVIYRKGGLGRIEFPAEPYPLVMDLEPEEHAVVITLRPRNRLGSASVGEKAGLAGSEKEEYREALVRMQKLFGEKESSQSDNKDKSRKWTGALFWPGLKSGHYAFFITGKKGRTELKLDLVVKRSTT